MISLKYYFTKNLCFNLDYTEIIILFSFQQMAPAKQAKVIKEFQKQSAQMDMTVIYHF